MNTEALLLFGYSNLFSSVFAETLVGSGNWFTQSLRSSPFRPTTFGQVEEFHQRARINWLLNLNHESHELLPHLIDNLGFEAGLRGSKFLCANANPESSLFETLRRTGYCSYGWEQFWQFSYAEFQSSASSNPGFDWENTTSHDIHDLKKFQHKYLPPAVRAVTPLANEALPELILKKDGMILAYARIRKSGSKGLVQPFIASDVKDWDAILLNLILSLKEIYPILYLQQGTSHDRLNDVLDSIATPVTSRLELMVKHFTIMEKSAVSILNHSAENSHPDPVTPFMNSNKIQDNL